MKIIVSSDWHFGENNNSLIHNEDLLEFTQWMIDWAKKNGITAFVHAGDFFHQRDKLNILTINKGMEAVIMLSDYFEHFYMLKGNHDIYFKDTRAVSSIDIFKNHTKIIEKFHHIPEWNLTLSSWLCNGEEYDELIKETQKNQSKFLIGHFEFNSFAMNDHYIMEHGQSHKELKHLDLVITGHYHGRQIKDNVIYIGNPFPMNFGEVNDPYKGFFVLDTETGEYEFVDYNKILVIDMTPEDFMETNWSEFDTDKISVRIIIENELSNKELDSIKTMMGSIEFRHAKIVYKLTKQEDSEQEKEQVTKIMSVDESVMDSIDKMEESANIRKDLLKDIYKSTINEH